MSKIITSCLYFILFHNQRSITKINFQNQSKQEIAKNQNQYFVEIINYVTVFIPFVIFYLFMKFLDKIILKIFLITLEKNIYINSIIYLLHN